VANDKSFGLKEAIVSGDTSIIDRAKATLINYYTEHPGFSKDILVYNTKTKTIKTVGQFDGFCPVTTNSVPFNKGVILTSGEIKPGIRTPEIIQVIPVKNLLNFWKTYQLLIVVSLLIAIGYIFIKRKSQITIK